MRSLIPTLFLALLILGSCSQNPGLDQSRKALNTMLGTWDFEGTELTETWSLLEIDHYQGVVSRSFNGVLEPMQIIDIEFSGDSAMYIGTRIGAHESAKPIRYRLNSLHDEKMVFENIQGIFPQEITYEVTAEDSFTVTMSGTQDGRSRSKSFKYKRSSKD